ncbi:MAG: hypothetical protein ACXAC5_21595 [Promethearchaeota archaeon]|jgi:hypothetical protein
MSKGNRKEKISRKGLILRIIILISFLLVLTYLYYVLLELGSHPIVVFFLLAFIFLITLGPFLKKKRGSLYSRMFPDRKKQPTYNRERQKRIPVIKKEPKQIQPKIFQAIDLEFEYRKPLISNCENCGNILPVFVKTKCPFCGEQV